MLQTIGSGILGAVGLPCVSIFYHWLFFRPVLSDGQYSLTIMGNFLVGAILGAVSGYGILHQRSNPKASFLIVAVGTVMALVLIAIYLWLVMSNDTGEPRQHFLMTLFDQMMYGLPTVLWLLILVFWMKRMIGRI